MRIPDIDCLTLKTTVLYGLKLTVSRHALKDSGVIFCLLARAVQLETMYRVYGNGKDDPYANY